MEPISITFPYFSDCPRPLRVATYLMARKRKWNFFYQNNKNLTIQVCRAFASGKIIMFEMFRTGKYLSDGMQSRVRVFANLKMEMKVFIME